MRKSADWLVVTLFRNTFSGARTAKCHDCEWSANRDL